MRPDVHKQNSSPLVINRVNICCVIGSDERSRLKLVEDKVNQIELNNLSTPVVITVAKLQLIFMYLFFAMHGILQFILKHVL